MTNKELLEDLLIEFDELDMQPMLTVPNPVERAKEWKHELTYAIKHLKADVAIEVLSDIKKRLHDKNTYPHGSGIDPYISLKVVDAIIHYMIKNELEEKV